VLITMRADNRGEGGSFALLALIGRVAPRARLLPAISLGALLATALFYGDAVITPAISILSAVEGLTLVDRRFEVAVLPVTVVITLVLFAVGALPPHDGVRRARRLNLSRDLRGIATLRFRTLNEITSPIVPTGTTSAPPPQAETAIPVFTLPQLACPSGTRTCRPTCGAG